MLGKLLNKFIKPKSSNTPTTARIDMDKLSPEERAEMPDAVAEAAGMVFFEGTIKHAYTLESVGHTHQCPRCNSETENQYGNYVYGTQSGTRIMMVPAGHFCVDCPTVIIDEDVVKSGMSRRYRYQGIIGMSHDGEDFYGFKTWNGSKPILIFDEDQNFLGMASKGDPEVQGTVRIKQHKARGKPPRKDQNTKKNPRKKSRKRK